MLQRLTLVLLIIALAGAAGSAQVAAVRETWAPAADVAVFRAVNSGMRNPFFDLAMPFITDFDNWRVLLLLVWLAMLVFGGRRGRWAAVLLVLAVAASDQVCASVIKPLVGRLRPCEVLGQVHFWNDTHGWITTPAVVTGSFKSSFSFPSNHASNITAAMLLLGLVYRKALPWLLLVALTVSFSRVYTGVHWPLDVVAGMAVGAVLAWLAWLAFRRVMARRKPAGRHTCF